MPRPVFSLAPCGPHPFGASGRACARGHALIEALGALALLGLVLGHALPMVQHWALKANLAQARERFEADWQAARWRAQHMSTVLRLQALPACRTPAGLGGWHCGWQVVVESNGQLLHESRLPAGLWVTPKPADGWRFDAWGEPLGGGASVLFQSASVPIQTPELLCLNVLGRLRRVQGEACSD
jgi:Tfp pilus assembly protein FimT